MILIFGKGNYGRVDEVPGVCYVATRFFHLYYVPLIPLSSWVILRGTEKGVGFQGQQIRLSAKSIVFGWLQAFLLVFGLMNSIWGGVLMGQHQLQPNNATEGTLKLMLGLMCLVAWLLFTIRPLRAGYERRNELLNRLGLMTDEDAISH